MTNRKFKRAVGDDPRIVGLMQMLGFKLGFGDLSTDEVCVLNGINPDLFSTLCDIYSSEHAQVDLDSLKTSDIPVILKLLRTTHLNYLESTFPALHANVHKMAEFCAPEDSALLNRFFDEYDGEMKRHIRFEEDVVFKYVEGLLAGERSSVLSVGMIGEMHNNVEEKLGDFKNIVMNYLPAGSTSEERYTVLVEILNIEDALRRHTAVEELVLLPLAEILEQDDAPAAAAPDATAEPAKAAFLPDRPQSILSDREKEIITEVARGLTNKEIADKLCISIFTVTTHRKNITQKLGIKTIAGLTVYALMNGFLTEQDITL